MAPLAARASEEGTQKNASVSRTIARTITATNNTERHETLQSAVSEQEEGRMRTDPWSRATDTELQEREEQEDRHGDVKRLFSLVPSGNCE